MGNDVKVSIQLPADSEISQKVDELIRQEIRNRTNDVFNTEIKTYIERIVDSRIRTWHGDPKSILAQQRKEIDKIIDDRIMASFTGIQIDTDYVLARVNTHVDKTIAALDSYAKTVIESATQDSIQPVLNSLLSSTVSSLIRAALFPNEAPVIANELVSSVDYVSQVNHMQKPTDERDDDNELPF